MDDIYVADTCFVTLVGDDDNDIRNDIKELVYDKIPLMIFSKGCLILENKLREFFTSYPFIFLMKCIIDNIISVLENVHGL